MMILKLLTHSRNLSAPTLSFAEFANAISPSGTLKNTARLAWKLIDWKLKSENVTTRYKSFGTRFVTYALLWTARPLLVLLLNIAAYPFSPLPLPLFYLRH